MIQLTKFGTLFHGSEEDLEKLGVEFKRQHFIRLPQLLEPSLASLVQEKIEKAGFQALAYEGIGVELRMEESISYDVLHLLANEPRFFQIMERVTECGHIGCFRGRMYRMTPGSNHSFTWHNDLNDPDSPRLAALSINLSREAYTGGLLEIRDSQSQEILSRAANTGPGDAIVFRIAPSLEHRVTPLEGHLSKTAFTGWFHPEPDFRTLLKQKLSEIP